MSFMVAHLGIAVETRDLKPDLEACIAGLAHGAFAGGVTVAIVAFTAFFIATVWGLAD